MGTDYWVNPALFLIETAFNLYIFALLLRFIFQWVQADYYNPVSQFLVKVTHPPLRLMRRVIPSVGRIDSASLVLMLLLQMLAGYLISALQGRDISLPALAMTSVSALVELSLNLFFFAVILRAIVSWTHPRSYSPLLSLLYSVTEPLLKASRRVLPPIGGVDLSPIIPLIAIQLAKMLILPPLYQLTLYLN